MTCYTHARPPGTGLLVVDLDLGTASGRLASRCRTSPMQRAGYTSSMALGTRYPTPGGPTPARADEREMGSAGPVKAMLKRGKHYTWKLCW